MIVKARRLETVYLFEWFDIRLGRETVPVFKATAEAIERQFHGRALPYTGEDVDVEELDSDGRWYRIPIGWGRPRLGIPASDEDAAVSAPH